MKKRLIAFTFVFVMLFSNSAVAFGANIYAEEMKKEEKHDADVITIRTEQDLAEMNERAVEEYDSRLSAIPARLKQDFTEFQENLGTDVIENLGDDTEKYTELFLVEYPEYSEMNSEELESDIELLAANPVVAAVRAFFTKNNYDLALTLFNHSLTANPAAANLELIGNSGGIYTHIKNLLRADGFTTAMINFSRAGSTTQTITNSSDWTFNNGDLYWAIHGFTWKRTRTAYNKAYFKIIDKYDFNKWRDIPGIVAGMAGTHEFDIEIYGLVQNGAMQ